VGLEAVKLSTAHFALDCYHITPKGVLDPACSYARTSLNLPSTVATLTHATEIPLLHVFLVQVLGRVAAHGCCCPVFTERKTERPAGVVSVAVKVCLLTGRLQLDGSRGLARGLASRR